jgi:hypothetical protein
MSEWENGIIMQSAKDEIVLGRRISPLPGRPHTPEKGIRLLEGRMMVSCPFCHKAVARFRLMDSTYHMDGFVRVAYFTCNSCSQDWSVRIDI